MVPNNGMQRTALRAAATAPARPVGGVNQALYANATAAVDVAMVMRYRVVAREQRGIAFWRLRERYFRIAGWMTQKPPGA
jgi:hypothetical protein